MGCGVRRWCTVNREDVGGMWGTSTLNRGCGVLGRRRTDSDVDSLCGLLRGMSSSA